MVSGGEAVAYFLANVNVVLNIVEGAIVGKLIETVANFVLG
jgi:hypothetical protein